jgi:hypothetical protein
MENNFLVKENNYFLKELKDTYPIGLIISLYDLYDQQKKINQIFNKNKSFRFNTAKFIKSKPKKNLYSNNWRDQSKGKLAIK